MLPSRSPIWSRWSHRHLLLAAAAPAAAALALAASALVLAAEPFNSQRPDVLVLSSLHHCQRWGMVCC